MDLLRTQFSAGLSLLLARSVGRDRAGALAEEVLRATACAVESGELTDPMGLPRLVRTMARRIAGQEPAGAAQTKAPDADLDRSGVKAAAAVLKSLPAKGREALERFYLEKQTPLRICETMNLSLEQFHRLKSKARQGFAGGHDDNLHVFGQRYDALNQVPGE